MQLLASLQQSIAALTTSQKAAEAVPQQQQQQQQQPPSVQPPVAAAGSLPPADAAPLAAAGAAPPARLAGHAAGEQQAEVPPGYNASVEALREREFQRLQGRVYAGKHSCGSGMPMPARPLPALSCRPACVPAPVPQSAGRPVQQLGAAAAGFRGQKAADWTLRRLLSACAALCGACLTRLPPCTQGPCP